MSTTRARHPDKRRQLKREYLTIPASSHSADPNQASIQRYWPVPCLRPQFPGLKCGGGFGVIDTEWSRMSSPTTSLCYRSPDSLNGELGTSD